MTNVEIEYCVPCGFLDRAVDLQRQILEQFGQEIDSATLITGDHGVFRVDVNGQTIYRKSEDEYDVDEILRSVKTRL